MRLMKKLAVLLTSAALLITGVGAVTAYAAVQDPLAGVVREDIRSAFRAEVPAGLQGRTGDPVVDEAMALGAWIRQKMGSEVPADIYQQGQNIGNRYEWFFGTDVSNNFENNFPWIYGIYFGMKSENQRKVTGTAYSMLGQYYEGAGASREFGRLYSDCQGFITACNNVARAQLARGTAAASASGFTPGWPYGEYEADPGDGRQLTMEFGVESGTGQEFCGLYGQGADRRFYVYTADRRTYKGFETDDVLEYNGLDQVVLNNAIVFRKVRENRNSN